MYLLLYFEMNEISDDLCRVVITYLMVTDCLRMELALHRRLHEKQYYMKLKEWEPLTNTIRLFKKGVFRTYRIYSYVKDGVTYSDVSVSPVCRSFQCVHKLLISPSVACHWVLSCITEGKTSGYGYIRHQNLRNSDTFSKFATMTL